MKELAQEVYRLAAIDEEAAGEDKLTNDCREKIQALKDAKTEEIEAERAEKEEPEDGWPEIIIKDEDVRVPSELLNEVLRVKLGENDCRNRGYILDSFPRLFKGAQRAFLMKPPKKEGEEDDDDDEEEDPDDPDKEPSYDKHIVNDAIFPGSVIVLDGSDEALIQRVRELPEDRIAGTHYNEARMRQRIKDYRIANNSQVAEPAVQDFFQERGIKFFKEDMLTRPKDALNSFKIYIERVSKILS